MKVIEEKFHVGRNLTFTFIDSFAKHPNNLNDLTQQVNRFWQRNIRKRNQNKPQRSNVSDLESPFKVIFISFRQALIPVQTVVEWLHNMEQRIFFKQIIFKWIFFQTKYFQHIRMANFFQSPQNLNYFQHEIISNAKYFQWPIFGRRTWMSSDEVKK